MNQGNNKNPSTSDEQKELQRLKSQLGQLRRQTPPQVGLPTPDFSSWLPRSVDTSRYKENFVPLDALKRSGITREGFLWAIEHMDPGGSHVSSPGCPDLLTGNRHLHPQRMILDIPAPFGLTDDATWDLVMITTPFVDMPFIYSKKPSSAAWDDKAFRDAERPLNDATMPDGWFWFPEYQASGAYPTLTSQNHRLLSRSITSECIGPAMYRSGRVISGQMPVQGRIFSPLLSSVGVPTSNCKTGCVAYSLPPIKNGAEMLLETDILAAERPADLGDYNVLRMSTPYGSPRLRSVLDIGEVLWKTNDDTEVNDIKWSHSPHHHSFNDDMNMGITFYEGLSSREVIKVKILGTAEISPKLGGSLATLARVVPSSDPVAIRVVADITSQLPHSYPASYNDLGGIFGAIGHALKSIGIPVARAVGSLGLPVVSPIAQGLGHIASAFGW